MMALKIIGLSAFVLWLFWLRYWFGTHPVRRYYWRREYLTREEIEAKYPPVDMSKIDPFYEWIPVGRFGLPRSKS